MPSVKIGALEGVFRAGDAPSSEGTEPRIGPSPKSHLKIVS